MSEITVIPIGGTGIGKSTLGCRLIEQKDAFRASSEASSCTRCTEIKSNVVNGTRINYIDNPGFVTTEIEKDKLYIEELVNRLHKWQKGINAFFITINIQTPRFGDTDKNLLKYLYYFFNYNPKLWNQTAIIFTRDLIGSFDSPEEKKQFVDNHRKTIIDTIKTFRGCENLNLQMECFCVNSRDYSDPRTINEFNRIRNFAKQFSPIPTSSLRSFNKDYLVKDLKSSEKVIRKTEIKQTNEHTKLTIFYYEIVNDVEIIGWDYKSTKTKEVAKSWTEQQIEQRDFLVNQLIDTKYEGTGKNEKKIMHYQDQERVRIIDNNGKCISQTIKVIKEWEDVKKATFVLQHEIKQIGEPSTEVFKKKVYKKEAAWARPLIGIFTGGISEIVGGATNAWTEEKNDYKIVTTNFQKLQREVITRPDGQIVYGNWIEVEKFKKSERINC